MSDLIRQICSISRVYVVYANFIYHYRYLTKYCRLCGKSMEGKNRRHMQRQHSQLTEFDLDVLESSTGFAYRKGWDIPFPIYTNWRDNIES